MNQSIIPEDVLNGFISQLALVQRNENAHSLSKAKILLVIYNTWGNAKFPNATTFYTYWKTHEYLNYSENYLRKNLRFARIHELIDTTIAERALTLSNGKTFPNIPFEKVCRRFGGSIQEAAEAWIKCVQDANFLDEPTQQELARLNPISLGAIQVNITRMQSEEVSTQASAPPTKRKRKTQLTLTKVATTKAPTDDINEFPIAENSEPTFENPPACLSLDENLLEMEIEPQAELSLEIVMKEYPLETQLVQEAVCLLHAVNLDCVLKKKALSFLDLLSQMLKSSDPQWKQKMLVIINSCAINYDKFIVKTSTNEQ